jgi:hypothetical protein
MDGLTDRCMLIFLFLLFLLDDADADAAIVTV